MRTNFLITVIIAILIAISSCKSKNQKETQDQANTVEVAADDNENTETTTQPNSAEDIVGEWELVGFIGDTNDNLLLDEEERKKLTTPGYKDYMKLNKDGSGLFTIAQLEGRYEAKESGGKKQLSWYDKANGEHRIGAILSVTADELLLKEPGGNGLFLWKRA